ncbi:hypothetical protein QBC35DRAFT_172478 [Podospora australis]|uniref:Zn(2)-C6 fungal-type domain-containing protein n=1 Tax=Podospora australis TaxID=1536484 RepID=A0AAN6WLN2_9PEZI|nr:hypothetical protein QBC35DRAFT_172478 [Podospora australis]
MTTTTMSNGRRKSSLDDLGDTPGPERTASPSPSSSTRSSGKQQIRHRASIACASCRERRIRCVVGEGETECTQCRRTGNTCIIKNDDERRRPISKAYMSSLSNRIALLEEMLKERGVSPPPAVHPPKTRQDALTRQQEDADARERSASFEPKHGSSTETQIPTPPGSGDEDVLISEAEPISNTVSTSLTPSVPSPSLIDPLLLQDASSNTDGDVRRLLSARGSHSFDPSAGRIRFFGPTANSHVHGKSSCLLDPQGRPDSARRVVGIIESLGTFTHNYLLKCFWEHNFDSVVVDQAAFETGRASKDARFYSPFLHLTLLAIGFRFADRSREDIKAISVGSRESTLHREAKSLLEVELEQAGGVPSVQGILLLADLEFGAGRDSTGWMYLGIANRLAFDIGLHVNYHGTDILDIERRLRHQVMAACVTFDRQWALILGRPTSIKAQDIGIDLRLSSSATFMSSVGGETRNSAAAGIAAMHRHRFELMELAGKVSDLQNTTHGISDSTAKGTEDRPYLYFLALERQFQNWYRRLPECLAWKPVNIKSAPLGFFLLHQQFHVCMILLHRPWAKYGPLVPDSVVATRYTPDTATHLRDSLGTFPHHDNRASLSRSMCTQHAVRVARIFWQHRQRFDGTKIGLEAIQHAGTAALALMAALAHKSAELDHQSNLKYLQVVSSAIYDMSHAYQPAARMYSLLKTMLADIRSELVSSGAFDATALLNRFQHGGSGTNMIFGSSSWGVNMDGPRPSPPRRRHTAVLDERPDIKRRRLSTQTVPDISYTAMPVFTNDQQPTCQSPSSLSQPQESSFPNLADQPLKQVPEITSEEDFDMDFFHASFVEFISAGSQGWETSAPSETPAEELPSETAPAVEETTATADKEKTDGVDTKTSSTPPPADEAANVDLTIEEWLSEPVQGPLLTPTEPSSTQQHCESRFSPVNESPAPAPHQQEATSNNSASGSAQAVNTPDFQSFGLSLGLDMELGTSDNGGIHTMDWMIGSPSSTKTSPSFKTPRRRMSTLTAPPETNQSLVTGLSYSKIPATPRPAPKPMTPVTLDELVQSVEEAVGCARARARDRELERERERERALASANAHTATVMSACNLTEPTAPVEREERNLALDFLTL